MPAVLVAFGMKAARTQSCPNPKHPNEGGWWGTVFCVFRHSTKGKWMFKCQNVDCNIRGDVIDFYKRMARWHFHKYRDVGQTARFLHKAVLEGVFDLSINQLEDYGPRGTEKRRADGAQQFDEDYRAITKMERKLDAIKPNQYLINSIAKEIPKENQRFVFSVAKLCRVLLEAYPDDSWMAASKTREWIAIQRKVDWLRNRRLCEQSYLFPMSFSEPQARRIYCLERQWAIIEFDGIDRKYQLSLHLYLAEKFPEMPLHLVVDSQGKSYHAYFEVAGVPREKYFELFKLARQLGCDYRLIRPEMRCRMPNGWNHKTESKQKIVWMSEKLRRRLEK
jgi:hypothetical protein